jgi:hypothetical protein
MIVGSVGSAGYRWQAFVPQSQEYLDGAVDVRAINSSGQSAGSGGTRLSVKQPALWNGTNVTWLGAPIFSDSEVRDLNDSGMMVGTLRNQDWNFPQASADNSVSALLWTNKLGIDLNSLVQLPPGARLVSAVAVNKAGLIAANMMLAGTNQAVLLGPTGDPLEIGRIEFSAPLPGNQASNTVPVSLAISNWPGAIKEITYHLHRRRLEPAMGGGDFWQPPRWQNFFFQTNIVTAAPFSTIFRQLPAGQYALAATVLDANGIRAYVAPVFFTVTTAVRLEALRKNMRDEFEYGFNGGAGFSYVVEESANLLNWTANTNTQGTLGGAFAEAVSGRPARYFRLRRIHTDPEYFGSNLPNPNPPASLERRRIEFLKYSNQGVYEMSFEEDTVDIVSMAATGSYTYTIRNGRGHLHIILAGAVPIEIQLELEWSISFMPNDWRGYELRGGQKTDLNGRFFERMTFPPPRGIFPGLAPNFMDVLP